MWCCNLVLTSWKNTGTKNIASTVAVSMPPTTPVPMSFWLPAPAPVADKVDDSRALCRLQHGLRLGRILGERLLANDVTAAGEGGVDERGV